MDRCVILILMIINRSSTLEIKESQQNANDKIAISANRTHSKNENERKCPTLNSTDEYEVPNNSEPLSLNRNNLDTTMTSSLVEEFSIEDVGEIGVRLQDVVAGDCGGSRVCGGAGGWAQKKTITIGFLGAYGLNPTALGALPLAVAAVNREPALLPGRRLRFVAADTGRPRPALPLPRDNLSLRVMTQMRDMGVVAFFGLDGTCHTEAKLAAAWDLPLISHQCAAARGTRQGGAGLGATFARTLPPANKISKSVVALLKRYDWMKFAIIVGDAPTASAQLEAIKELAQVQGMTVTHELHYTDYLPRKIADMEALVEQSYRTTRIYVFLGEADALRGLATVLRRRRLLTGAYAVVAVDDEIYQPGGPANSSFADTDLCGQSSSEDFLAYRAVLKLTPSFPGNQHYADLWEMIRSLAARPPFCVPNQHRLFQKVPVQIEAAHLYDAVTLWARAATAAMRAGLAPTEGAAVMGLLRPTTYSSVLGFDVYMDEAGDAEGNFTVTGLVPDPAAPAGWSVQPVATFRYANSSDSLPELVGGDRIAWIGGAPPICEPFCGFDGSKCASLHDPGLWAAVGAVGVVVVLAGALLGRHYRYEQKLASVLWKIDAKDLTFISSGNKKAQGQRDSETRRANTTIALYRGNIAAYKRLHKKSFDITRAVKKELQQMRELRHENLNQFIGVCVESGAACIVTSYCSRGSLARVLSDRDLHLDDMFVASLAADLLRGLTYLHDSPLVSHGNLTSSNCLVDSRWVLQISDFGLHNLKSGCVENDALRSERRMLWRAPELLREPCPPPRGSQRGDVYSFGIILYEILGRTGPWGLINLTNAEIIGRVRQPIDGVIFRPPLHTLTARPSIVAVLSACWSERPDRRPDLRLVRLRLKDMHAGMKTNLFDNMLAMMERYAANLEGVVAERTEQLMLERQRSSELLHRMLPRSVAEAVQRGERLKTETYDSVTIYQSNIDNFGRLTAAFTAAQVVDILNDVYACLDSIIALYNVDKVEASGDACTLVSGLPERCARHAAELASLALHVLHDVPRVQAGAAAAAGSPGLQLRIGIASGPCSAGAVGPLPRYRVFGPPVEAAARLEASAGGPAAHVSHGTYLLLRDQGYQFRPKNTGEEKTWLLIGEINKRRTTPRSRFHSTSNTTSNTYLWAPPATDSNLDIRDRARLSCGALEVRGPLSTSALSSPGAPAPACACLMPPRDHHSAPTVSFIQD